MKRLLVVLMIVTLLVSALSPVVTSAKPITPRVLEAVFIHYEQPAKGGPPAPAEPKVYDYYLALGPKWDLSKYSTGVPYVINPKGAPAGAAAEVKAGFEAWDAASSAELFKDNPTTDTNSWWGKLDGKNNVSWQIIAGYPNAIAATWIWIEDKDNNGIFSAGDEVLETDIVFNQGNIKWSIDLDGEGTAYKIKTYDVRNIATHEVGHVVGLDDFYETKYSEITMYGYSSKGETKKISLEIGDKNGTIALYGN